MKNVAVLALLGCIAATTAEAQCRNQRRGRRNCQPARVRHQPVRHYQPVRSYRQPAQRYMTVQHAAPMQCQTCQQSGVVQPQVQYSQPMVQYSQPMVQYSQPQMQYSQPMVQYSTPQPIADQSMMQPMVQQSGDVMVGSAVAPPAGEVFEAPAAPAAEAVPAAPAAGTDIVDTAVGAGSFNTLVAAVKAAGLVDTLKGDGPFTVFAPTDDAFAKLPAGTVEDLLKPENKDKLTAILTYHVVAGKVMAADVVGLTEAKTVNGKVAPITADGGNVTVGGANVVKTDIECSNGVIHVIDSVILP